MMSVILMNHIVVYTERGRERCVMIFLSRMCITVRSVDRKRGSFLFNATSFVTIK